MGWVLIAAKILTYVQSGIGYVEQIKSIRRDPSTEKYEPAQQTTVALSLAAQNASACSENAAWAPIMHHPKMVTALAEYTAAYVKVQNVAAEVSKELGIEA